MLNINFNCLNMSYALVLLIFNSNILLQEDPDSMTGGKVGLVLPCKFLGNRKLCYVINLLVCNVILFMMYRVPSAHSSCFQFGE